MKRFSRYAWRTALVLVLAGLLAYGFWPRPIEVDAAVVARGPLMATIDEDGKTRIKERYVVSAPLEGRLQRIEWHPGDRVVAGQSVLAVIEPTAPELLDARQLAQAEARVRAAQAAHEEAQTRIGQARVALEQAQSDYERAKKLIRGRTITGEEYERIVRAEAIAGQEMRGAEHAARVAEFEVELARAALVRSRPAAPGSEEDARLEVRSPIDGVVLRVYQESAAVVPEGARLLELGDPRDLELEIDVLSADGARIHPGDKVLVEQWGGETPLVARVRLVEPAAFLKISALGVEEQRVNVIADLESLPGERPTLGDAFRVEARIVAWESPDAVKVAAGALFRRDEKWATFVVAAGRAELRYVEVGGASGIETQILAGLEPGELVVLHPSDRIAAGIRVAPR